MSSIFEIRICESCGLRYPLTEGHSFGTRCPICLGTTYVVIKKQMGSEVVLKEKTKKKQEIKAVLLDNIRSAWNVGSILRTADGFGFSHAFLCGITPTPEVEAVRKTALGADDFVPWSYHKDAVTLVKGLKKEGWFVRALEEDERAVTLAKGKKQKAEKIVLIAGSEVTGVDPELLDLCDEILYIPMHGGKKSFNVSVAFGVAGYVLSS